MQVSFSKDGGAGNVPAPVIDINGAPRPLGPTGNLGPDDSGLGAFPGQQGQSSVPATTRNAGFVSDADLPAFKDVMLPHLNLVHDIGELKESFSPGELVWAQQTVLFTPPTLPEIDTKTGNITAPGKPGTPPVILTVLGEVQKRFAEIVIGGARGMLVNTEADVRASGGTLDWNEWNMKKASGMKRFGPLLDLLVVIERPEIVKNDGTVFGFDCDGKQYALGLWSLSKTGYTEGYKKALGIHRLTGVIKGKRSEGGGYPTHSFAISTRLQPYPNGNKSWVPVVIPNAKSSPAFMAFVEQILNPTA